MLVMFKTQNDYSLFLKLWPCSSTIVFVISTSCHIVTRLCEVTTHQKRDINSNVFIIFVSNVFSSQHLSFSIPLQQFFVMFVIIYLLKFAHNNFCSSMKNSSLFPFNSGHSYERDKLLNDASKYARGNC